MFGQLRDLDVDWLSQNGSIERVAPQTEIIREGQQIDMMYILLDGLLVVTVNGIGDIAELLPGEVVGEMSFVSSLPTSANVIARTACRLFAIRRDLLDDHLASDPDFSSRFYKSIAMFLAQRLRTTVQRLGHGGGLEDAEKSAEADDNVLDGVYLAGLRFERLISMVKTS
jgi:CRP-like cAMP-binding protein